MANNSLNNLTSNSGMNPVILTVDTPCKYFDEKMCMKLHQDPGNVIFAGEGLPNCTISDGTRSYKDIYTLAKILLYHLSEGGFMILPQNVTNYHCGIAKHFLTRRQWRYEEKSDSNQGNIGKFYLPQEVLFGFICAKWSPAEGTKVDPKTNDRVHLLIGILLSDEHCLDCNIILMGHHFSTGNHQDIDNPAMRVKDAAWARISVLFNNNEHKVNHPLFWDMASDKEGFEELDPNDTSCFVLTRDGGWLSWLYKSIIKDYRVSFEKYTKGTGGGPGGPADYHDLHGRYGDGKLYLTWIYMKDKEVGYKLCSKYDDIPHVIDGNHSRDSPQSMRGRFTSPKQGGSAVSKFIQDTLKEMNTSAFKEVASHSQRMQRECFTEQLYFATG
jgi:hypothetical protein